MPLVSKIYSFVSNFILSMILPSTEKGVSSYLFGRFFGAIWEGICNFFYFICKWLLAFMDFLQYFIQKLIGLDYWLDASKDGQRKLSEATSEDIIFKFLYADSVQKVFRALVAVFVVLLIIFTIYAIIKSEWDYMTGDGSKGNSKASIFRSSIKAIALVIAFPILLVMGIVSSNAILASIIKAVGVDMSDTFGGKIFSVSAQFANKYRHYVSANTYLPTTDSVTFYLDDNKKQIMFGSGNDEFHTYIEDYREYLLATKRGTEITIDSIFDPLVPKNQNNFRGFCFRLEDKEGNFKYYLISASTEKRDDVYYYLTRVLGAKVLNKNSSWATDDIGKALAQNLSFSTGVSDGCYINGYNIHKGNETVRAVCRNSWNYSLAYINPQRTLSQSIDSYGNQRLSNFDLGSVGSNGVGAIMFNSSEISAYFDGGQFGNVQSKAEYGVMADVVEYMCNNNLTFYIMDATSPLINWNYHYTDKNNTAQGYTVESKWISNKLTGKITTAISNGMTSSDPYVIKYNSQTEIATNLTGNVDNPEYALTFLTKYSGNRALPVESEQDIIYTAKFEGSELLGSKYIICMKGGDYFYPLVNGKDFEIDSTSYCFKSDYYASEYKGVVWAKGTFDTSTVDAYYGNPTYLKNSSQVENGKETVVTDSDGSYYYEISSDGTKINFYNYYTRLLGNINAYHATYNKGSIYAEGERTLSSEDNGDTIILKMTNPFSCEYKLNKTSINEGGYTLYASADSGFCYILFKNGSNYYKPKVENGKVSYSTDSFNSGGTLHPIYYNGTSSIDASDLVLKSISLNNVVFGKEAGDLLKNTFSIENNGEYFGTFTKTILNKINKVNTNVSGNNSIEDGTKYFEANWGTKYYNIKTEGRFKKSLTASLSSGEDGSGIFNNKLKVKVNSAEGQMLEFYDTAKTSDSVTCYRRQIENYSGNTFGSVLVEINVALFKAIFEIKTGVVQQVSNREIPSATFTYSGADAGINFDYFFDKNTKLQTFYSAAKINYPLMLIASALIIKVLFSALWGVIKRFYMITLYYLAMPVAASTMPIDDGKRFGDVREKIVGEVLSTYGVLIGLNVFFVLLAPIREISSTIFTDEAIANSGSYFLKNLKFSASVLNEFIYVLFLLVAFTLINELPGFVQGLVGKGKGVDATGAETRGNVSKSMKSATEVISGQSLVNTVKEGVGYVPGLIPGSALIGSAAKKVTGGIGKLAGSFKEGADSVNSGGGGASNARYDGDDNPSGGGTPGGSPGGAPGGGARNNARMGDENSENEDQNPQNVDLENSGETEKNPMDEAPEGSSQPGNNSGSETPSTTKFENTVVGSAGDEGEAGDTGTNDETGETGDSGEAETTGEAGEAESTGETETTGEAGEAGSDEMGSAGDSGEAENAGELGDKKFVNTAKMIANGLMGKDKNTVKGAALALTGKALKVGAVLTALSVGGLGAAAIIAGGSYLVKKGIGAVKRFKSANGEERAKLITKWGGNALKVAGATALGAMTGGLGLAFGGVAAGAIFARSRGKLKVPAKLANVVANNPALQAPLTAPAEETKVGSALEEINKAEQTATENAQEQATTNARTDGENAEQGSEENNENAEQGSDEDKEDAEQGSETNNENEESPENNKKFWGNVKNIANGLMGNDNKTVKGAALGLAGKVLKTAGILTALSVGGIGAAAIVVGGSYLVKKGVAAAKKFKSASGEERAKLITKWGGNALKVAGMTTLGAMTGGLGLAFGGITAGVIFARSKGKLKVPAKLSNIVAKNPVLGGALTAKKSEENKANADGQTVNTNGEQNPAGGSSASETKVGQWIDNVNKNSADIQQLEEGVVNATADRDSIQDSVDEAEKILSNATSEADADKAEKILAGSKAGSEFSKKYEKYLTDASNNGREINLGLQKEAMRAVSQELIENANGKVEKAQRKLDRKKKLNKTFSKDNLSNIVNGLMGNNNKTTGGALLGLAGKALKTAGVLTALGVGGLGAAAIVVGGSYLVKKGVAAAKKFKSASGEERAKLITKWGGNALKVAGATTLGMMTGGLGLAFGAVTAGAIFARSKGKLKIPAKLSDVVANNPALQAPLTTPAGETATGTAYNATVQGAEQAQSQMGSGAGTQAVGSSSQISNDQIVKNVLKHGNVDELNKQFFGNGAIVAVNGKTYEGLKLNKSGAIVDANGEKLKGEDLKAVRKAIAGNVTDKQSEQARSRILQRKAVIGVGVKALKTTALLTALGTGSLGLAAAVAGGSYLVKKGIGAVKRFKSASAEGRAQLITKWGGNVLKVAGATALGAMTGGLGLGIVGGAVTAGAITVSGKRSAVKFRKAGSARNELLSGSQMSSQIGSQLTSQTQQTDVAPTGTQVVSTHTVADTQNSFVNDNSAIANTILSAIESGLLIEGRNRMLAAAHIANYESITDKNFVTNTNEAYRNVVVNTVGSSGGKIVAGDAIANYAKSHSVSVVDAVLKGYDFTNADGENEHVNALMSDENKIEIYKSMMTSEQLDTFNTKVNEGLSSAEQLKFIEGSSLNGAGLGLNLGVTMSAKGIGFTVNDMAVRGKGAKNDSVNNAIGQILTSGKISSADVVDSLDRTKYFGNATRAFAGNYALSLDYKNETINNITGSEYHQEVFERALKNEDINAEAIYEYLKKDKQKLEDFNSAYHITDETTDEEIIGAIKSGVKNNQGIFASLKAEDYAKELSDVTAKHVGDGSFKVKAFDLLSKAEQMDYADHVAANLSAVSTGARFGYTESEKQTEETLSKAEFGDSELVNTFLNSSIENKDQIVNSIIGKQYSFVGENNEIDLESEGAKNLLKEISSKPALLAKLNELRANNHTDSDILVAYAKAKTLNQADSFDRFVGRNELDKDVVEKLMGVDETKLYSNEPLTNQEFVNLALNNSENKQSVVDKMVMDAVGLTNKDGKIDTSSESYNNLVEEIFAGDEKNPWTSRLANSSASLDSEESANIVLGYAKAKILGRQDEKKIDSFISGNDEINNQLTEKITKASDSLNGSENVKSLVSDYNLYGALTDEDVKEYAGAEAERTKMYNDVKSALGFKDGGDEKVNAAAEKAMIIYINSNGQNKEILNSAGLNIDNKLLAKVDDTYFKADDFGKTKSEEIVSKAEIASEEKERISKLTELQNNNRTKVELEKQLTDAGYITDSNASGMSNESATQAVNVLKEQYLAKDGKVSELNASLQGTEKAGDIANYLKQILPQEQLNNLVKDGSANGFSTLTNAQQNAVIAKLALKDDGAISVLKENEVDTSSMMAVSQFLNSALGQALKERIISEVKDSLFAMNAQRLGLDENKSYEFIKQQTQSSISASKYEQFSGDLISNENVKSEIAKTANSEDAKNIIENAANKFNLMTAQEKYDIGLAGAYNYLEKNYSNEFKLAYNPIEIRNLESRAIYNSVEGKNPEKIASVRAELEKSEEYQKLTATEKTNAIVDKLIANNSLTNEDYRIGRTVKMSYVVDKVGKFNPEIAKLANINGKTEALKEAKINALANGGLERQRTVANLVWSNSDLKNVIQNAYRAEFGDVDLDNPKNEIERNNYIFNNYSRFVSADSEVGKRISATMERNIVDFTTKADNGEIIRKLKQNEFDIVVKDMKDDGDKIVSGAKQNIIQKQNVNNELTQLPDTSKMTKEELADFENAKSQIQQFYRKNNNSEEIANLYRNVTLVNDSETIKEILSNKNSNATEKEIFDAKVKALRNNKEFESSAILSVLGSKKNETDFEKIKQYLKSTNVDFDALSLIEKGRAISELLKNDTFVKSNNIKAGQINSSIDSEIAKRAKTASNFDVKMGLTTSQINAFLNGVTGERTREHLFEVGANQPDKMFRKGPYRNARMRVIGQNPVIRKIFVNSIMRELYTDPQMKKMIRKEVFDPDGKMYMKGLRSLTANEINRYINEHLAELKEKLGTNQLFKQDSKGNYQIKDPSKLDDYNRVADKLEFENPTFAGNIKSTMASAVRKMFGIKTSEEIKKDQQLDELLKDLVERTENNEKVQESINKIVKKSFQEQFKSFMNGENVRVLVESNVNKTLNDLAVLKNVYTNYNNSIASQKASVNRRLAEARKRLSELNSKKIS